MHPDIARLHIDDEVHEPVQIVPQPVGYSTYGRSRDITKDFLAASAELHQGQLIKDEYFTLFESVGALEIMDPKMDSGFMMPEKDAIVDNFDPLKSMLPEEIIGIMDQMLCHEMSWHDGYPLSQTLFTSLHLISIAPQEFRPLNTVFFHSKHIKKPDPLISEVLRAFCIGLLKSCDSVIADIISEHYYEEEDFVTQTFSQYLLSDIDDAAIIAVLQSASRTLESLDLPADLKSALSARLDLRRLMLQAYEPQSASTIYDEKANLWQQVLTAAAKVNDTASLGKAVPDVFSERVQRHLASNTPPRPMIVTPWSEAYPKLQRLCSTNIEAYKVVNISENPSAFNIIRFTADFSSQHPQPPPHARSTLQSLLFRAGHLTANLPTRTPHISLLTQSLAEIVLTADPLLDPSNFEIELPTSPRHQIAREITIFLSKAQEEFLNIPRMLSQNLCRQRRTLNQSLAILDSLQAEAEGVDAAIQDIIATTLSAPPTKGDASPSSARSFALSLENLQFFPLAAWTYFYKLLVAEWTVLLGFETEVYLPDESAEMYAFLAYLAQTREEHLGHVDFFAHRRAQRLARLGDRDGVAEVVRGRAFIKVLVSRAKVVRELAGALKSIYALLIHLSLLPSSSSSSTSSSSNPKTHIYSTPPLRHELRLKPFLPLGTPPLPTSTDLKNLTTITPTSPTSPFPSSNGNENATTNENGNKVEEEEENQEEISKILSTAESSLKQAKLELLSLKTVKPEIGRFVGCEKGWADEVKGLLGTVVAAGVVVVGVRGVLDSLITPTSSLTSMAASSTLSTSYRSEGIGGGKRGEGGSTKGTDGDKEKNKEKSKRDEFIRRRWRVEIPAPEKRWRRGWVVPKVLERKE